MVVDIKWFHYCITVSYKIGLTFVDHYIINRIKCNKMHNLIGQVFYEVMKELLWTKISLVFTIKRSELLKIQFSTAQWHIHALAIGPELPANKLHFLYKNNWWEHVSRFMLGYLRSACVNKLSLWSVIVTARKTKITENREVGELVFYKHQIFNIFYGESALLNKKSKRLATRRVAT